MTRSARIVLYALVAVAPFGCARTTAWLDLEQYEPAPSETGVRLAVRRVATLAYVDEAEPSPHADDVARVTRNSPDAVRIGLPAASPTHDMVLYSMPGKPTEAGRPTGNIWRQEIGATARALVTSGRWLNIEPAFTPDGRHIVFTSDRVTRDVALWRVRVDGAGGVARLTDAPAQSYRPNVSPDGEVVAHACNAPQAAKPQIWTITRMGTLPTQLCEGECPRFSPDGKKILFLRRDPETGFRQLWVMDRAGTNQTQLTQNLFYTIKDPNWSPDGRWIAYAADRERNSKGRRQFDIWIMTAYGSDRTRLTTNGSWDDGPCWDRAGRRIYFRSNRGARWDIWRLSPRIQTARNQTASAGP